MKSEMEISYIWFFLQAEVEEVDVAVEEGEVDVVEEDQAGVVVVEAEEDLQGGEHDIFLNLSSFRHHSQETAPNEKIPTLFYK